MQKVLLCLLFILSARSCRAQVCMPTKAGPQPESGYSYIRTEILALQWIRAATTKSEKLQWIATDDPQRVHKSVEFYATANSVSDDYDCAVFLLAPYKDSKNESIHGSVDALLLAIQTTKEINGNLITMMETLNKAKKAEDIDQQEIAKTLGNIKSMQKDVRNLAMVGVKMSTFGILHIDGTGDDAKPTAFTITGTERQTLLSETRVLAKAKGKEESYVDLCADILLTILTSKLPSAA
jgi:hypothetical protein